MNFIDNCELRSLELQEVTSFILDPTIEFEIYEAQVLSVDKEKRT